MNELTFLDLAILHRIDDKTYIEKFGSRINTSFFETANLMGTLKIKGLIDFEQSIGGNSKVSLSSKGKYILELAERKAKQELDELDKGILGKIAQGFSKPEDIKKELNIRSEDLAFHLEKIYTQGYIDYYLRSAEAFVNLTEKGYNKVGHLKKSKKPEKKKEKRTTRKGTAAEGTGNKGMSEETGIEIKGIEEGKRESAEEGVQTKITDVKEDIGWKRRKSKISFYWNKYKWYYILLIIIIIASIGYLIYTLV